MRQLFAAVVLALSLVGCVEPSEEKSPGLATGPTLVVEIAGLNGERICLARHVSVTDSSGAIHTAASTECDAFSATLPPGEEIADLVFTVAHPRAPFALTAELQ